MPHKGPYKAVQCTSLSKTFEEAIEKLEMKTLEQKPLGPGQMRIKVFAASLNFFDLLMLVGKYQVKPNIPFTVLNEGSGEVIEIAPDVQRFKVGDNVVFGMNEGALCEELVLSEHVCARKPPNIDHVHASGLYVGFTTAYHGAHLKKGEVLLVTGAGGGMGTAAIQIGKLIGATVIAVASTPEKLQVAKQVGADYVINYTSEDLKDMVAKYTDGKWADVVYECVGGDLFHKCVRCVAGEGRLLIVGFTSGKIPDFPVNLALVKGFSVVGVRAGMEMMLHPELAQEMYNKIEEWGNAGKLIPFVDRVFDLSNYKEAFRVLAARKALGKVVVRLAVAHAKL